MSSNRVLSLRFHRKWLVILLFLGLLAPPSAIVSGKNIFRPAHQIMDNFKHLNLSSNEFDPDVAPPASSNNVEIVSLDDGHLDYMIDDHNTDGQLPPADAELLNELASSPSLTGQMASDASIFSTELASISSTLAPTTTSATTQSAVEQQSAITRYCKCVENNCSCCRNFNIPIIPIKGPGCAKISYLGDDRMSVTLKYGDITLASRTISSKKARPICINLPGGFSRFCGRFYGLAKTKDNFKACLGLELRADDEIEASMRVSCFKFGPEGLRVAEAEPYPTASPKPQATDSDEDDDDDDDEDEDETDEEESGGGLFDFGTDSENEEDDDEEDEYEYDEDSSASSTELIEAINDTDVIRREGQKPGTNSTKKPSKNDDDGLNLTSLFDTADDDDDDKDDEENDDDEDDDDDDDDENDEDDDSGKKKRKTKKKPSAPVSPPDSRLTGNAVQSKGDDNAPELGITEQENCVTEATDSATNRATDDKTNDTKKHKAKKDKKKKKSSDDPESFAYDILEGLFEFFN